MAICHLETAQSQCPLHGIAVLSRRLLLLLPSPLGSPTYQEGRHSSTAPVVFNLKSASRVEIFFLLQQTHGSLFVSLDLPPLAYARLHARTHTHTHSLFFSLTHTHISPAAAVAAAAATAPAAATSPAEAALPAWLASPSYVSAYRRLLSICN